MLRWPLLFRQAPLAANPCYMPFYVETICLSISKLTKSVHWPLSSPETWIYVDGLSYQVPWWIVKSSLKSHLLYSSLAALSVWKSAVNKLKSSSFLTSKKAGYSYTFFLLNESLREYVSINLSKEECIILVVLVALSLVPILPSCLTTNQNWAVSWSPQSK